MSEEAKPSPWLYAGIEISREGDPSIVLIDASGEKLGEKRLFKYDPKRHRKFIVGWVYQLPTVEHDEGRLTVTFDDRSPSKSWPIAEERQAIAAASRAAEAVLQSDKIAAQLEKADLDLDRIMAPLKKKYRGLIGRNAKIAFELIVLEALRRGG